MRGRKPIPTAIKIVEGNRGHRPLPADEPVLKSGTVPCPKYLNPVARKIWNQLIKELLPIGVMTPIDWGVVARLADGYGRLMGLKAELAMIRNVSKNGKKITVRVQQYRKEFELWDKAKDKCFPPIGKDPVTGKAIINRYLELERSANAGMLGIEKQIQREIDLINEQNRRDEIELGRTPSSRSRVKALPPAKPENKKERFFT